MNKAQSDNKKLNDVEYSSRQVALQSTPPNVIFCTNYKCNMKCIFCLERGDDPDFKLSMYKDLFAKKLDTAIAKATHLFYTGWGEVLLSPEIEDFLDYLNITSPDSSKCFTTNGSPLHQNLIARLLEGNYSLQISLHTANPMLHRLLTQTESFEQIKTALENIASLKKSRNIPTPCLHLIFVATTLNIENLPEFIDFAARTRVNGVTCNYVTIFKPEHIKMSCFFLKDTTNRMFDEAQRRAKDYGIELSLPPRFGTGESLNKLEPCRYPWDHLFVDAHGNVLTCCYAGDPIANLHDSDFTSLWNSQEYRELRKALIEGKSHRRCQNCYKFHLQNVDDIRSHITFRGNTQAEIFKVLGIEP